MFRRPKWQADPSFGERDEKDRGLAVLVGVWRCHEMGIGEGLVKSLAFEALLGALLTFCLQSFGLFAEPFGIPA